MQPSDVRMFNLITVSEDGAVEWPAWLEQLHASEVAQLAAVGVALPSDRQLAVSKLEDLKLRLRRLIKSKKKAARDDVFRRLEKTEGGWRKAVIDDGPGPPPSDEPLREGARC